MPSQTLKYIVDVDASGAIRGFKQVGSTAKSELDLASSKTQTTSEKWTSFGKTALVAGAVVGGALYKVGSDASDLAETMSKAGVVFGEAAGEVTSFGDTAAETLGQSKQQAIDAATSFAVFGKAAGLAGTDLAGFSTDMVTLASDMASFSNTSPEQAIEAIGAALRGESEPIRAYGVMLDDATLKAAAMKLGIYDGTGALTQQQKVLAAHASIMDQTTDAQGDFARTADGAANQQRVFTAELKDLSAKLGQAVLPAMQALLSIATKTIGIVEDLGIVQADTTEAMSAFLGVAKGAGSTMADTLNAFGALVDETGNARSAFDKTGQVLGVLTDGAKDSDLSLNNLKKALQDVYAIDPSQAATVVDGLQQVVLAAKNGNDAAQDWVDTYGLTQDVVNELASSLPTLTAATEDQTTATDDTTDSTDGAKQAADRYADALDGVRDSIEDARDELRQLTEDQLASVDAQYGYMRQTIETNAAIEEYNKQLGEGKLKGDELWLATDSVRQQMVDTATAFATAGGQAEGTSGYIDAMVTSLENQMTTLAPDSPLRQAIQGYIDQLLAIPTRVETDFRIKGDSITVNGRQIAVPARYASGGRTGDGVPYIVGDNADGSLNSTSEMVVPGAGAVHSARDTQDILRGLQSGGDGVTINFGGVTITSGEDADGFARHLSMVLAVSK